MSKTKAAAYAGTLAENLFGSALDESGFSEATQPSPHRKKRLKHQSSANSIRERST
ncbi:hypothetical protein AB0D99_31770 [Streptomyces sp. NPDC047971]|uniref:hypothetical protein n=1 Tax=Streptomyces sp. NPDC047971 TaxID=3154499 RepID=UPI0033C27E85